MFIAGAQFGADEHGEGGTKPGYAEYDLGQAAAHLTLQAVAMGLHAHQFAGFDRDEVAAELGVPTYVRLLSGIAVGIRGNPDDVPERDREREHKARRRRPLTRCGPWPSVGVPLGGVRGGVPVEPKSIVFLVLVAALINLPMLHGIWLNSKLDRQGVDVTAEVMDDRDRPGDYLIAFRVPAEGDREEFTGVAKVDQETHDQAVRTQEIEVRILPDTPGAYRVEGQVTGRVGLVIALLADLLLVILVGLMLISVAGSDRRWSSSRPRISRAVHPGPCSTGSTGTATSWPARSSRSRRTRSCSSLATAGSGWSSTVTTTPRATTSRCGRPAGWSATTNPSGAGPQCRGEQPVGLLGRRHRWR